MAVTSVEGVRCSIQAGRVRETWEAYMAERWFREHLSGTKYLLYAQEAKRLAAQTDWETYTSVFMSVVGNYRQLAEQFGLPAELRASSAQRMMTRFMIGRINTFQEIEREEGFRGKCIEPGPDDLHNCDLAEIFAMLPPQPETAKYLKALGVDYRYDHLHMVTWFAGQLSLGEGFYSRSCPNHSAKVTYERLKNPRSLLWIAAALGEDPAVVAAAGREAEGYESWTAQCGVIRRAVPWKRIYGLALRMRENCRTGL